MMVAPTSPAAVRQARLRRDRAAALALRVAFPEVEQLHLDLRFDGATATTPASQSHVLHPPARAYFEFPCPYANCDGQFNLSNAVQAAMADPAHHAQGVLECVGVRARDFASKQPCQLHLIYTITAVCRQDP